MLSSAGRTNGWAPSNAFLNRCAGRTRPLTTVGGPVKALVRRGVLDSEDRGEHTSSLAGMHPRELAPQRDDRRFRWSQAISWAWEDSNLRPHPER
jgi:hypothetical protein